MKAHALEPLDPKPLLSAAGALQRLGNLEEAENTLKM